MDLSEPVLKVGLPGPDRAQIRNQAIHFCNHATIELNKKERDLQLAYRLLSSACALDPTFALAWYQLGNANADLKLLPASVACFRTALALPDSSEFPGDMDSDLRIKAQINLGHRLYHLGRMEEAEFETLKAIKLGPNEGFPYTNLSMILSLRGDHEAAIRSAEKAYELSPGHMTELGVAFANLFGEKFIVGLKHFEARFPYQLPQYMNLPYKRWNGERDVTKTLVVLADQGLGDTLCYARFIEQASHRVGAVVMMVQPELFDIIKDALSYTGSNIHFKMTTDHLPYGELWVPLMSLPVALGLTDKQFINAPGFKFPPIKPAPTGWKNPTAKLHVGIAWSGSPANEIDKWRSIPYEQFIRLTECAGVQLYGLQIGPRAVDIQTHGTAGFVRDLSPFIKTATQTAEFINEMDLVISCESFIAHLAAAVGKPCWTIASKFGGDYRIGRERSTPIWAATTNIIRQLSPPYWNDTFEFILERLRDKVAGKTYLDEVPF